MYTRSNDNLLFLKHVNIWLYRSLNMWPFLRTGWLCARKQSIVFNGFWLISLRILPGRKLAAPRKSQPEDSPPYPLRAGRKGLLTTDKNAYHSYKYSKWGSKFHKSVHNGIVPLVLLSHRVLLLEEISRNSHKRYGQNVYIPCPRLFSKLLIFTFLLSLANWIFR